MLRDRCQPPITHMPCRGTDPWHGISPPVTAGAVAGYRVSALGDALPSGCAVRPEGLRVRDAEIDARRHERRHPDSGSDVIRLCDPRIVLLFGFALALGLYRRRSLYRSLWLHRGGRGWLGHASSQVECLPSDLAAGGWSCAAPGHAVRRSRAAPTQSTRLLTTFGCVFEGGTPSAVPVFQPGSAQLPRADARHRRIPRRQRPRYGRDLAPKRIHLIAERHQLSRRRCVE